MLLWNLTEADAHAKALQLEAAIDALTFTFGDSRVSAGASAGIAVLGLDVPGDEALAKADDAMYARKKQRRAGPVAG